MSCLISKAKVCNYIKACVNPYGKPFRGTTYEFGLKIMEYIENSECDKTLEEHDKEIRDKAIDTFMIAIETLMKLHGAVVLSEIQEIAEKMKEVDNG